MENYEQSGNKSHESEPASSEQIQMVFGYLKDNVNTNPKITSATLEDLQNATGIHLEDIDSTSMHHLPTELDPVDHVYHHETVAISLQGWNGVTSEEQTVTLVVSHDPTTDEYGGFVLKSDHDASSYDIEHEFQTPEFIRTIATYRESLQLSLGYIDEPGLQLEAVGWSSDIQPLTASGLMLMLDVSTSRNQASKD